MDRHKKHLYITNTTLSDGSLGSHVDEERSKMCELMWTAQRSDHWQFERKWRL